MPCPETLVVDFLGKITKAQTTLGGRLCIDCDAPSPDGMHLLEMDEGTRALDSQGKVVKLIEIREVEAPPLPPNTVLVGNAYNFEPTGMTFSRPVRITLGYNVGELPGDTATLIMAYYSSEAGWTALQTESSQVAETGSLTARTNHQTVFAILAEVSGFQVSNLSISLSRSETWGFLTFAVRTGEEALIAVDVANTGDHEASYAVSLKVNGGIRDGQEITLAPGQSEHVAFTISGNEPGRYAVVVGDLSGEFTSSLWINWWLIGGILGALAVIGSLAAWWYMRRGSL